MKKKQRGLADHKNADNRGQSKILLITLSVIAIILTIPFSVVVIMALNSKKENTAQTTQQENVKEPQPGGTIITEPQPGGETQPEGGGENGQESGEGGETQAGGNGPQPEGGGGNVPPSGEVETEEVSVGDIISLGKWNEQSIEWQVLAVESEKALVVSKYIVDVHRYNNKMFSVTWENCELRKWLNDYFYMYAFSGRDKKKILETTIFTEGNPEIEEDDGCKTNDKVFLLSAAEAEKYFASDEERICSEKESAEEENVEGWWLRSSLPGYGYVYDDGYIDKTIDIHYFEQDIDFNRVLPSVRGVRPAMWISLKD